MGDPTGSRPRRTEPSDITAAAVASFSGCRDERLRVLLERLTAHLHAFAAEVGLTQDEWEAGIRLLTETGHITDEHRQEFVLWSDTLGLSMLVDALASPSPDATESTVLGPFYAPGAPRRQYGEAIAEEDCRSTGLGARRRHRHRRSARRRCGARRLAERRQPPLRRAGPRRARGAPPRPVLHPRGRELRVPGGPAGPLHDPGRRARRRDARRGGQAPVAPGAHPPDPARGRLRARHHAHLRP